MKIIYLLKKKVLDSGELYLCALLFNATVCEIQFVFVCMRAFVCVYWHIGNPPAGESRSSAN